MGHFNVYLLVVVVAGSVVRMTGSGMGCPDWPKCFDQYISPTSAEQLPKTVEILFIIKGKKLIGLLSF